ncbi:sarcosine oxidase subunit alpha [Paraburkholderia sp. UCT70]|uniref:2Fe-2S iron-sulfur cluster-binding protein n=1 Tax=Paraburkholderia sp. UCT70 TaxID=2991068 RepID=UPI003D226F57
MSQSFQSHRLSGGGGVDRSRTLQFTFNGKTMKGHPGDTLASALMANGVSLIGRSFKYHRPRGFYGAGLEDPNSMLAVRDGYAYYPALRAGQIRLVDGMQAESLTGWPSTNFDVGAIAQLGSAFLVAGFYYKTFKWPDWKVFEPAVRRTTGFGRPDATPDRHHVQHRHASCNVLIIGGGPVGLAAANTLLDSGLNVFVVDDQPVPGGSALWEAAQIGGQPARAWTAKIVEEASSRPNFTVLSSTTVTGAYESNVFTLTQSIGDARGVRGECHWKLNAQHVVLASGMVDRPMLFQGNDRPGIMLSSAVRRLMGEFAVSPAKALAVYTNNDSGYLTALEAQRAGVKVVAIIDIRKASEAVHAEEARTHKIPCFFESQIEKTSGYRRLSGITVRDHKGERRRLSCDGLAVSGGWTPLIHLAAHRGVKPSYDHDLSTFVCREAPPGWFIVGGANGTVDLDDSIGEALKAGTVIAAGRNVKARAARAHVTARTYGTVAPTWKPGYGSASKMWIDLQNDVKVSDVEIAARENYVSVEHLKRYTTLGMGTDQGRTSNVNGLAVMAGLTGREIGAVGTTTFRPPYTAVRMSTIANARTGDRYQPRRYLPADAIHRELRGVMEDFGWERPDWYQSNGNDRENAVAAEMAAVRNHVGVFDGSSLGKIEVTGPDAGEFLAKFYVSNIATLKPGRIRYSVMLREDGVIFDDGVVTCIGENHFLAGPSSGNAEAVAAWFERWRQTEWPNMRVAISPVTSNWASIAIAGPRARELLSQLEPDFDISHEAFPHMDFREGSICGVTARVARISYTGELQYEISVQARYASSLLRVILEQGKPLSIRPVGMEAWLRLRLEKGYLHLGSDTNGRTTPLDVGMGPIVSKRKGDFIGKRSLGLSFATSNEREQLVGLTALNGTLSVGGRVMAKGHESVPCPTVGYVTSACVSPSVGRSIGLALIEQGSQRDGETVSVYCDGEIIRCQIGDPTFYDPSNERLQA